jgi:uncharacterized protein
MITTRLLAERAAMGDPNAKFWVGYRMAFGRRRKRPPEWREIVKHWHSAAEAGHVCAQFFLATCFDIGRGLHRDPRKALIWYRKAAQNGHQLAQFNIALAYENGDGLRRDPRTALKWYSRSALQGHVESQLKVGYCYHEGLGIQQDYRVAVHWYQKAARRGDPSAQYNLGLCYKHGEGVRRSKRWARYWLERAACQGNHKAMEAIVDLLGGRLFEPVQRPDGTGYSFPWYDRLMTYIRSGEGKRGRGRVYRRMIAALKTQEKREGWKKQRQPPRRKATAKR